MHEKTILGLNEILAAERAGVETLAKLLPGAREGYLRHGMEKIHKDEGWSCTLLHQAIEALGGKATADKGDFAQKVMALPTLTERLELLGKGQRWVVKRLDTILEGDVPGPVRDTLKDVRREHEGNIQWCLEQLEALKAAAASPH